VTNKPLILIVDDVDFFLEVEKGFLKNTNAAIETARNGQEALDAIERNKPDLIYLDVNMPIMDGLECCRKIKEDPKLRDIPVVVVYAKSKGVDDLQVKDCGCDGILHKPVDRNEFLELGRNFLPQVDRRFQRVPCQMTVEFSLDNKKHQGQGYNISLSGMYIQHRETIPDKARLRLSFFLPTVSQYPIESWGEVTWKNFGFPRGKLDMPQGFGVEFKLLNSRYRNVIEQHIDSETNNINKGG
jgi:CheY-like chemotaxis protein